MPISNPLLIQGSAKSRSGRPAPLFLIHDASGQASAYFKLGPLGRSVYGLYDPKFDSNGLGGWQDVRDMAQHYIMLIRRHVLRGPIILGGWSFGGIVAVEMAHQIATCGRGLTVSGILMLDSVYSKCERPEATKRGTSQYVPGLTGQSQQTQDKLITALVRATCLADNWCVPEWTLPRLARGKVSVASPCHGWAPRPPPVILIRATEKTPMRDTDAMCVLDRTRFLPQLGWEDMHPDFVTRVFPVKGTHYTLFDEPCLSQVNSTLVEALALCEC